MIIYEAHFKQKRLLGALFSLELWPYIMCFCVLGTASHRTTCHSFIPPSSPGRGEPVWIFLTYRWGKSGSEKLSLWLHSTQLVWGGSDSAHQASGSRYHAPCFCSLFQTHRDPELPSSELVCRTKCRLSEGWAPPQTQQPFPFCVLWQCWKNYLLNPDWLHSSSLTLTGHLYLSKDTSLRPYLQNEGGNLFLCKGLVKSNQTAYVRTLHSMPRTQWNSASACFLPFPFLNFWTSADISSQLTWMPPMCFQPKHPVGRSPGSEPTLLHLSLEWIPFLSYLRVKLLSLLLRNYPLAQQFLTDAGAY